ncbi:hypothetical protein HYT33_04100 [Candidatus Roizmanbacteria bacterium]|nr:hypothetical protein [Candidatus Roizmanbacteria bacterium]
MENFNKVLYFILGLVVVLVFVIVVTRRLNLQTRFLPFATPTPKTAKKEAAKQPQEMPAPTLAVTQYQTKPAQQGQKGQEALGRVSQIPSTGAPLFVIPAASSALLLGLYLRRQN